MCHFLHLNNIIQTYVREINRENSDLDGFQFYATLEALGITGTNFTYQVFVDRMPVNAVLICRVSGLTFTPTNGEFYLRATCTGYPESKRIEFEAIEMSSSLSGVYKARYSAPAGTKWSGWKSTLTNAELNDGTSTRVSVKSSGGATRMTIDCTSPNDGYVGLEGSDGAWYRRLKFLSDGKIIYAYKATGGAEVTKLISDKPS